MCNEHTATAELIAAAPRQPLTNAAYAREAARVARAVPMRHDTQKASAKLPAAASEQQPLKSSPDNEA